MTRFVGRSGELLLKSMNLAADTHVVKRALATLVAFLGIAAGSVVAGDRATAASVVGDLNVAAQSVGLRTADRLDPPTEPPPTPTFDPRLQRTLDLVNAERSSRGLPALRMDTRLNQAAQAHSVEQARYRTMTHTGRDGSDAGQRISRTGYTWRRWGENVAYGFTSADSVMTAWMNSSGHRANILGNYTEIGLGLAYTSDGVPYWTQVFATPG